MKWPLLRLVVDHPRAAAVTALIVVSCATSKPAPQPAAQTAPAQQPAAAPVVSETGVSAKGARELSDAYDFFAAQKKAGAVDWENVEKRFEHVANGENVPEAYFNMGVALEQLHRKDEAAKAYNNALQLKPSLHQARENLAVILQNDGKLEEAKAMYGDILRQYPEDSGARARLAAIYRETGDYDNAIKFAKESLARDPKNLTALKALIRAYREEKKLSMAKLLVLRAEKLDENDPEIYFALGLILSDEGDEPAALVQFRKAAKVAPDYMNSRKAILDIALKHGDYPEAAEQLQAILKLQPKNIAALQDLAVAYRAMGKLDKALEAYDAELKLQEVPAAYFGLGVIQKAKQNPDKALEYFKKFQTLQPGAGPNHPVVAAIQECEQAIKMREEVKKMEEDAKRQEEERKRQEAAKKDAAAAPGAKPEGAAPAGQPAAAPGTAPAPASPGASEPAATPTPAQSAPAKPAPAPTPAPAPKEKPAEAPPAATPAADEPP